MWLYPPANTNPVLVWIRSCALFNGHVLFRHSQDALRVIPNHNCSCSQFFFTAYSKKSGGFLIFFVTIQISHPEIHFSLESLLLSAQPHPREALPIIIRAVFAVFLAGAIGIKVVVGGFLVRAFFTLPVSVPIVVRATKIRHSGISFPLIFTISEFLRVQKRSQSRE